VVKSGKWSPLELARVSLLARLSLKKENDSRAAIPLEFSIKALNGTSA